jgi:hypothetical protein
MMVMFVVTIIAQSSLPGETLYPIKRAVEQVERSGARLTGGEAAVRLDHAERRAREAAALLDEQTFDPALVQSAIEELTAAADVVVRSNQTATHEQILAAAPTELVAQTVEINALLDSVLTTAQAQDIGEPEALTQAARSLTDARLRGAMLLPPQAPVIEPPPDVTEEAIITPEVTDEPSETPEPPATATDEPTETPEPTATETDTPSETPEPTETATDEPSETPEPPANAEAPIAAWIDAEGGVNVRSGPGTNYDIIAVLEPRSTVTIIGENEDGSWYNVRLLDGRSGWIATFLVSIGAPPPQRPGVPVDPDDDPGSGGRPENPGDFGCDQPGNACNAPGNPNDPGPPESPPGQGNDPGPPANPPGRPENPGQPADPGPPANPPGRP